MCTAAKTAGKAMYVATSLDKSWLRSAQSKLYARSSNEPDYVWRKLWGLVTDRRNLRLALVRVSQNKGARTAGVDGRTVRAVLHQGPEAFIERLRVSSRPRRWKARCITKGARRVWRRAPGNGPGESRATAPGAHSTAAVEPDCRDGDTSAVLTRDYGGKESAAGTQGRERSRVSSRGSRLAEPVHRRAAYRARPRS